ncbi:hypothetical protein GCM10020295_48260 [Streptomyces cinereospinus]
MTVDALTDVTGLRVGHATRTGDGWLTGTTVVLAPEGGAVTAVDVRGGGPGTKETDALDPRNVVQKAEAVVLTGGSAYGLDAASGVMAWLEERGRGVRVGPDPAHVVPVVPAACVFDLGRGGDFRARPDAAVGRAAVEAAAASGIGAPVPEGCVGAGTGAAVGPMKGGVGTASTVLDSGITVAALVVANAAGSVTDPETGGAVRGVVPGAGALPGGGGARGGARTARRERGEERAAPAEHHARGRRHRRRPVEGAGAEAGRHGTRRHRAGRAAGASAARRRHRLRAGHRGARAGRHAAAGAERHPGGRRGRGHARDRAGGAGGRARGGEGGAGRGTGRGREGEGGGWPSYTELYGELQGAR